MSISEIKSPGAVQDSSSTLKLEGYKDAIVYVLHTFCVWAVNQNKQASVGPKHCEWLEIP